METSTKIFLGVGVAVGAAIVIAGIVDEMEKPSSPSQSQPLAAGLGSGATRHPVVPFPIHSAPGGHDPGAYCPPGFTAQLVNGQYQCVPIEPDLWG